jgi:cytochrome c oxidase subunit 3
MIRQENAVLGMWFAMAAVLMLFMGLTSAYVARRGLDPQWQNIGMPPLAAVNAGALVASSVTLEIGRRSRLAVGRWVLATWVLGVVFLAGQLIIWRQLAGAGMYVTTNPHSSFFYVLTATHGLHLLGGIVAMTRAIWMPVDREFPRALALYWHFLGGLWVYLLVVLFAL